MSLDSAILGAVGGGLLRLAPEVIRFADRFLDRKHELRLQEIALQANRENPNLAKAMQAFGDDRVGSFEVSSLMQTIREQFTASTSPWVNLISIFVRPTTTYALVALYIFAKVWGALHGVAFGQLYSPEDYALLGGILAFWFADRSMKRGT